MKEDFDYSQVPYGFLHCLRAECPRSADCLRFKAARHASPHIATFSVINPLYIAGKDEKCPHFKEDRVVCFALGITHLFDHLPYAKVNKIKQSIRTQLHRTTYYRILRKERYIKPEEQSIMREVFHREGIKEDLMFDKCVYTYDW